MPRSATRPKTPDTPKIKSPTVKKPPYKIGISNSYIGNDWRTEMIQIARAYANLPEIKNLVSELYVVSSGMDAAAQIAIVDLMIANGYDAIILNTASEEAINPAVKRAHEAGIPVITFDNVSSSPYAVRINEDQFEFGKTMAEWLVKQLNGKGNVFMITGVPGTTVDNGRNAGAHSVFDKYPDIKILGEQPGMWANGPAQTVMANALAAFPQIDGVWCSGRRQRCAEGFPGRQAAHSCPSLARLRTASARWQHRTISRSSPLARLRPWSPCPSSSRPTCSRGWKCRRRSASRCPIAQNPGLVEGKDYFPKVNPNMFVAFQLPQCGVLFNADEILAQDAY